MNVTGKITKISPMQKENMTTKQKTPNVTTTSMAGIASKELQAQNGEQMSTDVVL